ncbi:alpha/beta hydrolase [Psychrosphaera sp. F3M07]|uniref:serine aminopeptidase domain-containing protein n=1 Tax=Psychrosphaera sp. F3M07 TaxID=2841560 RepID=UPI001C08C3C7|nr:alpha/beta hydrolase [Psychrosphaera sp. F3M07]MBU2918278.1 alpha/beta hydrolase [Psychrosphaera sp. F3M07]
MKYLFIIAALLLSGCAINITPASFIYQSEKVEPQLDIKAIDVKMSNAPSSVSNISVITQTGITLNGIKLTKTDAIVNVVLFGGNGMRISASAGILNHFALIPANVIWFDYQGMGVSEKSTELSIDALKIDALSVFDFAKKEFTAQLPLVVHGVSMGSLIAGYVASERHIDGLVLDGAISSVPELVENLIPTWSKLFSTVTVSPELSDINNEELIAQYTNPLLILSGENDETTPLVFSQQLFNISPSLIKSIKVLPNTTHAQPMKKSETIDAYKIFINKLTCCQTDM